jgi:hypothetical protein
MAEGCERISHKGHEYQFPPARVSGCCRLGKATVAGTGGKLEPDPDCPDLLRLERALLADQATLIPGTSAKPTSVGIVVFMVASSIPATPPSADNGGKPM